MLMRDMHATADEQLVGSDELAREGAEVALHDGEGALHGGRRARQRHRAAAARDGERRGDEADGSPRTGRFTRVNRCLLRRA
jgi:hypothetical protein